MQRRELLKLAIIAPAFSWEAMLLPQSEVIAEDDEEDSSESSSLSIASSCSCTGRCLGGLADCGGNLRKGVTQADVDAYLLQREAWRHDN